MANLKANKIYGTSGLDANGSALFNGTDYLTAANAAAFRLNQGSGADFTIEAWIYAKSVGTQFTIASLYHTTGNKRSYNLYVNTDAELKINYSGNGTAANTSVLNAGTIPTNEWIHVAVTHDTSATTLRLFKNGVLRDDDTGAHATWYANTDGDFVVGSSLDGFISNLHINKGTCKYTAAFDPYKQPIEVETNTSVLCCNSSTDALNDDKSNTFVQTASDGVKPTSDMPFSRSDAGVVFDGDIKINSQGVMYFPTGDTTQRGRGRAVFAGGNRSPDNDSNIIDYIQIQSSGIAVDFGDLTQEREALGGSGNETRGWFASGYDGDSPNANYDIIDYITISTTANALDFGNLSAVRRYVASLSNSTRGVIGGGYGGSPAAYQNIIEYITIATTGNVTDFGDTTAATTDMAGLSSPTRGILAGGTVPGSTVNTIEYITIATTGNATNFGDLTVVRRASASANSSTRGVFGGGHNPSLVNTIDYITIASTGDATDFGDLTSARSYMGKGQACTVVRGLLQGGLEPSLVNKIEYIEIATTGNAADFGDLTGNGAREAGAACDSHGGIA